MMFSQENRTKSILISGPSDLTRPFIFESAINWAGEGHRVCYIAPAQLTEIPAKYHDRESPTSSTFSLIRFIYLANYEALIKQLAEIHTFEIRPTVLLIDSLDTYIQDNQFKENKEVHIARLCAIILDSMNACSRILKSQVYICAAVSSITLQSNPFSLYYDSIWQLKKDKKEIIELRKIKGDPNYQDVFQYEKYLDKTIVIKSIFQKPKE